MIQTVCNGKTVRWCNPITDGELWNRFRAGAATHYDHHGCADVLAWMRRTGAGIAVNAFCLITDDRGNEMGGVAIRSTVTTQLSSVVAPWPDPISVIGKVTALTGRGPIIEAFAGWSSSPSSSNTIAAQVPSACALFGARHLVASSARHALPLWERSGGRVVESVPTIRYPADGYETALVHWDRNLLRDTMEPMIWELAHHQLADLFLSGHLIAHAAAA